jgi:hypothetical protein
MRLIERWLARRETKDEELVFVDLVTGHASARFKWVDVRPDDERVRAPFEHADAALSVDRLRTNQPLPLRKRSELVVFGSDAAETREATSILERRGYEVLPAPRGYETLRRHGLL